MATSGTYSFAVTRDDIIRQALLNIRRLDPDDSPPAVETNDCARVLNMLCKQWMGTSDFAPGLKVWTRKRGHLLLSNSTGTYTLGPSASGWTNDLTQTVTTAAASAAATSIVVSSVTGLTSGMSLVIQLSSGALYHTTISSIAGSTVNFVTGSLPSASASGSMVYAYSAAAQMPIHIETAILRDDVNDDTPLRIMTVQDYDYLPSKADVTYTGDPTAILYETGLSSGTLRTDVGSAQDVSKHIVLTYLEPVQDLTNPTDAPYYPQEWYLALCWGLSEQICPMFGANWTQKMEGLKNTALAIARNKDPEISSLFFQPGASD